MLIVGLAFNGPLHDASTIGWTVAALGSLWCIAVHLDQLRIVDIGPKRTLNCLLDMPYGRQSSSEHD